MLTNRQARRALAHLSATAPSTHRASWANLFLLFCGIVALAIQSFVVQPHIHGASGWPAAIVAPIAGIDAHSTIAETSHTAVPARPRDRYPVDGDPANCPLCQEIAYSLAV